jgi:hypothetical protein
MLMYLVLAWYTETQEAFQNPPGDDWTPARTPNTRLQPVATGDTQQYWEPDRFILDQYGFKNAPPAVWSTPQVESPPCLESKSIRSEEEQSCPVSLDHTEGTPEENFSIGSILPMFTYTEKGGKPTSSDQVDLLL